MLVDDMTMMLRFEKTCLRIDATWDLPNKRAFLLLKRIFVLNKSFDGKEEGEEPGRGPTGRPKVLRPFWVILLDGWLM
ncbi:hypothetical protein CW700_03870 [Candidatus Bathyarchaeota archaeon]|nr:MAG: hypothetical protein CW700_03870 [Candidatus Bathyarchaeota archaeon]